MAGPVIGEAGDEIGAGAHPGHRIPPLPLTGLLVIIGLFAVTTFISPSGQDTFRYPKLLLLRLDALLIVALAGFEYARGRCRERWFMPQLPSHQLVVAILIWTFLTTLFSTNLLVSAYSLFTVVCYSVFFFASFALARSVRKPALLYLPLLPAIVNAGLFLMQVKGIWNPFATADVNVTEEIRALLAKSALLGNTNDVGGFLVLPAMLALHAAITGGFLTRIFGGISLCVITAALVSSESNTAIIALCAATLAFILILRRRVGIALIAAVLVLAAALIFSGRADITTTLTAGVPATVRDIDTRLSGRLVAFLSAARMGLNNPLLGAGPGRFAGEYFDQQIEVQKGAREYLDELSLRSNYAETHNDFLQVFAETGLAGLLLMLAALRVLFIAGRSIPQQRPTSLRLRLAAVSTVTALAVLSMAHFPLQLAATMITYVYVAGIILGDESLLAEDKS